MGATGQTFQVKGMYVALLITTGQTLGYLAPTGVDAVPMVATGVDAVLLNCTGHLPASTGIGAVLSAAAGRAYRPSPFRVIPLVLLAATGQIPSSSVAAGVSAVALKVAEQMLRSFAPIGVVKMLLGISGLVVKIHRAPVASTSRVQHATVDVQRAGAPFVFTQAIERGAVGM